MTQFDVQEATIKLFVAGIRNSSNMIPNVCWTIPKHKIRVPPSPPRGEKNCDFTRYLFSSKIKHTNKFLKS